MTDIVTTATVRTDGILDMAARRWEAYRAEAYETNGSDGFCRDCWAWSDPCPCGCGWAVCANDGRWVEADGGCHLFAMAQR